MNEEILVKELTMCYECIRDVIADTEKLKRLRARARDMPTEIFVKGLPYTLILLASRGDLNTIQETLVKGSCKEIIEVVKELKVEKFGYTMYLSLLLYLIRKLGIDLGNSFSEVLRKTINNPILEKQVYVIVEWIKRFSEAYLPEEG